MAEKTEAVKYAYLWYNIIMSTLTPFTFLQPTFWSYRLIELDTITHKTLIIKQILDQGDIHALNWLRHTYNSQDIKEVIETSMVSEWSKKSLSLWSKIYNITPNRPQRFV